MKNKIKLLIRYFKALKVDKAYTRYMLTYKSLEDKFDSFRIIENDIKTKFKVPKFVDDIIFEIYLLVFDEAFESVNLNYDDFWTIDFVVDTKNEILTVFSENKIPNRTPKNLILYDRDVNRYTHLKNSFSELIIHLETVTKNSEVKSFSFDFGGAWDDGWIENTYVNEKKYSVNGHLGDDKEWDFIYYLLSIYHRDRWNQDSGVEGNVEYNNDEIFVSYDIIEERWEKSDFQKTFSGKDY